MNIAPYECSCETLNAAKSNDDLIVTDAVYSHFLLFSFLQSLRYKVDLIPPVVETPPLATDFSDTA